MNEEAQTQVGKILEEITSKKDWYNKVFVEDIIAKWKNEVPREHQDDFWLALRILQATAKGVYHDPHCEWSEQGHYTCKQCKEEYRQELLADYANYGYQSLDEALGNIEEGFADEDIECTHIKCGCTSPNFLLRDYVLSSNDIVDNRLHGRLQAQVKELEKTLMIVDWHPQLELTTTKITSSKSLVRDLVHPSLYCYVKGVSRHADGSVVESCAENEKYAWLPAEVEINDGKAAFTSYVNNLDADEHPALIHSLEECFSSFLPSLEKVLNRTFSNSVCVAQQGDLLKQDRLQVIVKIATIELDEEHPAYEGGTWHIEGMPYEHIGATCLHYLQVEGIANSYLEFRKPVYLNELEIDYPQSDAKHTEHHFGIVPDSHYDGEMNRYIGLIKCTEGSSVVFPNSLQHHVKSFSLEGYVPPETIVENKMRSFSNTNTELAQAREEKLRREQIALAKTQVPVQHGKRTIIAFFVIDPDLPIVSTADVPKQQEIFTREEADYYREQLMIQRKYFVDELNKTVFEREYSLCEH